MTQEDPLSMFLYGLGMALLAECLTKAVPKLLQPWYSNDLAMAGQASQMRLAMTMLSKIGLERGYYPKPSKSIVICSPDKKEVIQKHLAGFGF